MIPEALIDQIRVCAAQNRQVRQTYSYEKEEAAERIRGRSDEIRGRLHPEERLLLSSTDGELAVRRLRSSYTDRGTILLRSCSVHQRNRITLHHAVPLIRTLCRAPQTEEPRRTAASKTGILFTGTFSALPSVNQNRDLPFFKTGRAVTKSALPAQTGLFTALPPERAYPDFPLC